MRNNNEIRGAVHTALDSVLRPRTDGGIFGNPKGNHPTSPGPIPVRSFDESRNFLPGAQFVLVGNEVDQYFDEVYFKHGLDMMPEDGEE